MRYIIYLMLITSCSYESELIIDNINKKNFYVEFKSSYSEGYITDRHSCLGKSELFNCDIKSKYFFEGTTIEIWAVPAFGYSFKQWNGSINSKDNPLIINIDSDKEIIAEFSN
ncbi:MAG: hypothetical protein ACJZ00_03735 [Cytophagales bacterium]|nr:MAG: hypothetical protein CND58_00110 [Rhodothermaeota bacterium MED-G16]